MFRTGCLTELDWIPTMRPHRTGLHMRQDLPHEPHEAQRDDLECAQPVLVAQAGEAARAGTA